MFHTYKRSYLYGALSIVITLGSTLPVHANSEFDFFGTILKRPVSGIVNVRSTPSPTSKIVGIVKNGQSLRVTGGTCTNAKTGKEIDLTVYRTAKQLYRAMKAPNVFCPVMFEDGYSEDGWVRGTHILPN